jgi:hypothetical protein
MKPKFFYLALCIIGTLLPASQLMVFIREHGLNVLALFEQLFSNPAGRFFGADVIVSSVVLWVFVFVDGRRDGVRWLWLPILANLLIGVSSGLPLFLYMREVRLEKA